MSRKRNRVKINFSVSQENYLAVMAAITPPGQDRPGFGVLSDFFDGLLDNWRNHQALQHQPGDSK